MCFARRDIIVLLLVGQRVRGIDGDVLVEFAFQEASLEALVVAILDLVVVTAWEVIDHFSPFGTDLLVELDKFDVLLDRPLILDNAWIDPVQPALAALLW